MQTKRFSLVLVGFWGVALLALFWPGFLGYPLQGIDGSIGIIKALQRALASTAGQWQAFYWMGSGSTDFGPGLFSLALRLFPAMWLQNLYYPLIMVLAMGGMWLWLRRLGRSEWAALFGSLGYGLMPHWVSLVLGGHLGVFEALAWLPWLLWALSHTFRASDWRWWPWALVSGALWGLMMNADIQRGFYLSLVAASMVVLIWYTEAKESFWGKLPLNIGRSFVVAMVLFMVMSVTLGGWVSILEGRKNLQQTPSSSGGWEFATQFSQDPRELIDSLAFGYHGKLSGDPEAPYWGTKEFNGNSDSLGFFVVVFGLLGLSFFFHRETPREDKPWLLFWGVWTILGLLLAFGKFWPGKPLYWLFYHLPIMGQFRVPLKWLIVTGLGLVVTSSYALDRLLVAVREEKIPLWRTLTRVALALVGVSFLWLLYHVVSSDSLQQQLYSTLKGYASLAVENRGWALARMMGLFVVVAIASGLVWLSLASQTLRDEQKALARRVALGLVFIGLLVDTITVNGFYFDRAFVKEGEGFYRQDELITQLAKTAEPFRVAPSLLVEQNGRVFPVPVTSIRQSYLTYDFLYHGIEAFDVPAESAVDASLQNFMLANYRSSGVSQPTNLDDVLRADLPIFQMANVRYLILDALITNTSYPLAGVWRDKRGGQHAVYEVAGSLPRLSWFSQAVSVASEAEAMEILSRPDWPRREALVVEGGQALSATNASGTLRLVSYQPARLEAEVESAQGGYVLMASRYHRQWRARLDGGAIPVLKANIAQMAVYVPAGRHRLVFSYEADRLFQVLSWAGVGLALISGLWLLIARAKER